MKYADLPAELRPTEHPVHGVLSEDELGLVLAREDGAALYADWFNKRERLIALERSDPLGYGVEIEPCWRDARRLLEHGNDLLVLGGNRAGKTEFAGKFAVETLVGKERRNVWCFQSDERASIERQQPYVYRYLPPGVRDIGKKGRVTNVSFTVKNGFSEGIFVLPNAAFCRFMSYAMDPKNLEGAELDLVWCDELVPPDMLTTLRFRLVTRGGKMLVTFTPIYGYSVAVADYLDGARVVESRPAPLLDPNMVHVRGCRKGEMPYILECAQPGRFVICFHSQFNPFNAWENLVGLLQGASLEQKKCRAYGWPTRQIAGAFAKFGDVHIVKPEEVPGNGTNYLSADPGGAKNWFLLWARVDDLGRVFVYREWPDWTVGEWALASEKFDGKPGPAQRAEAGRGIRGYKELILEKEGWAVEGMGKDPAEAQRARRGVGGWGEEPRITRMGADGGGGGSRRGAEGAEGERIYLRLIDPRAGAAQVPGIEDGTSIIDMAAAEVVDKDGQVVCPAMFFTPAPGGKVDEGVTLINDLIDYDTERAVDGENCPRLYVSAECKNLIYALRTWTGVDGEKGATKDPVDALRYLVKFGLEYVDATAMRGVAGRGF